MASRWLPGEVEALLAQEAPYPPALTGLRGSHVGSFETLHALRDGAAFWKTAGAAADTGEEYDLVVVGAGISGLAAAYFYRQARPDARILVLDNHDDFGGHAKRNEFSHNGRTYIGYGGTQSIDSPQPYSPVAKGLITDLGIDVAGYGKVLDGALYKSLGLRPGTFFDKETFGADRLVVGDVRDEAFRASAPFSEAVKRDLARLLIDEDRPDAGALRRAEEGPPRPHQLQGLRRHAPEARPRRPLAVPDAHARSLRRRHRRGPGAGCVRAGPPRVRRHGPGRQARSRAELRLDAQRGRVELLLPLPGRQCDRRAPAGAPPRARRDSRHHDRGHRLEPGGLRQARRGRRAGPHPPQRARAARDAHGSRRRRSRGRSDLCRRPQDLRTSGPPAFAQATAGSKTSRPSKPAAWCWRAGTP